MLWSAFILGLLGSLHCIGMCGPIAFMLPVNRENSFKKIAQVSIYHTGRLLAYGLIGALFGVVGKGFYLFGIQQQLSIIVGLIMILVVLLPATFFSKFNVVSPLYSVISKIKSALGNTFKKKTADTFLTIGFLNGFLPCGLVYMAVFASLVTKNVALGSMYMILFGAGTIPLMTMAVYLGKFVNTAVKQRIQKAIPVFIVVIGMLFIIRGLGLDIPYISPAPVTEMASGEFNCH